MRFIVAATLYIGLGAAAGATEITLVLPGDAEPQRRTVAYDCGGSRMSVEYVNAGDVMLAVFAVEGRTIVASNVLAASGARYAGSHYVWWNKGEDGYLYDLMRGEDGAPLATCKEAG